MSDLPPSRENTPQRFSSPFPASSVSSSRFTIAGTEETVYFNSASIGVLPARITENHIVVASSNNGAVQNIVNELPLCQGIEETLLEDLKQADYFREISNAKVSSQWKKDENGKNREAGTRRPVDASDRLGIGPGGEVHRHLLHQRERKLRLAGEAPQGVIFRPEDLLERAGVEVGGTVLAVQVDPLPALPVEVGPQIVRIGLLGLFQIADEKGVQVRPLGLYAAQDLHPAVLEAGPVSLELLLHPIRK